MSCEESGVLATTSCKNDDSKSNCDCVALVSSWYVVFTYVREVETYLDLQSRTKWHHQCSCNFHMSYATC